MKQFELTLTVRDPKQKFHPFIFDHVEADDILQLMQQFMFCVISIQKQLHDKEWLERREHEDDIPF